MTWPFAKPKIDQLDRYLAEGKYDTALKAVVSELRRNPSRFNLLLRQAEILALAGNTAEAVREYCELAEKFAKDGFYAKAIALYKKVLRLDPSREDVHQNLARAIEANRLASRPLEERLPDVKAEPAPEAGPPTETDRLKELEASKLFSEFTGDALREILTSTSLRSYHEGDIIVTEGESGSSLFLIVSGDVKVFTRGQEGEHIQLAELGPGDFFGEVSLLTGRPRTATITAKNRVMAIELTRASVDGIADEHPEVLEVLKEFYEKRTQDTVEAVIRRLRGSD